ncbi:hypothetical protein NFI96_031430, partial [Prochilodus magdalenae]
CTLENRGQLLSITAHTGGSVLLPCYCTDLQTTPEGLIWQKENRNTQTYEEISSESGQYRNRVQLFNDHSPGNLSLLISHLTEEDGGDYQCAVKGSHAIIRLTAEGNSVSVVSFSLIPVLLLLMVLGGVIYWRCRGRRQGQAESREQQQTEREQKTQDDVTYSTIVLSRTPAAPTVIGIEDKAEYATLKEHPRGRGPVVVLQTAQSAGTPPGTAGPRVNLILLMCVSTGCTLVNRGQLLPITAHTGGSVLLPCSCTDLQIKPEEFTWKKYKGNKWVDTTFNSDQYRNKVQMYNHRSPGNLSLLISHLTEEDGGEHKCVVKGSYLIIRLTLEGCTLENKEQLLRITAHTGGSVLLPCSCTDLQTTPEEFSWKKDNRNTQTLEEISRESGQYRNRVQLFNDHSPGNLSLLISHLTEEDGGEYECAVKDSHIRTILTVKEGPPTPAPSTTPKPAPYTAPKPAPPTAPKPAPPTAPKPAASTAPKPAPSTTPKPTPSTAVGSVHSSPTTSTTRSTGTADGNVMYWFILIPVVLLLLGIGGVIYWICRGCTLENREQLLRITAHTGGSVLLPCSCTDLQTKPEEFSWKKDNRNTQTREEISRESGQYRNRVQLFNDHSPGNLSLLISHLTEEDGGDYECAVKGSYMVIRLTVKEPLPFVPFALVTVIFLHIIVAVVYHTKRTKGTNYTADL